MKDHGADGLIPNHPPLRYLGGRWEAGGMDLRVPCVDVAVAGSAGVGSSVGSVKMGSMFLSNHRRIPLIGEGGWVGGGCDGSHQGGTVWIGG